MWRFLTATTDMHLIDGRRIYTLHVQACQWSFGEGAVKNQRFGCSLAPDFGGTAHAYCGSAMDAALGDCLSWSQKPRLEDMLKAYVIKSRITEAENLLLKQAYSLGRLYCSMSWESGKQQQRPRLLGGHMRRRSSERTHMRSQRSCMNSERGEATWEAT